MFLGTNCYKPYSFKSTLSSETRLFSCARQELCKLHSFCSTDLADRLDTVRVCVYMLGCLCVCLLSDKQQKSFQIQIQSCKTDDGEFAGEKKTSKWKKGHRRERERSNWRRENLSLDNLIAVVMVTRLMLIIMGYTEMLTKRAAADTIYLSIHPLWAH